MTIDKKDAATAGDTEQSGSVVAASAPPAPASPASEPAVAVDTPVSEPPVLKPSVSEPSVSESSASKPSVAEPSVSGQQTPTGSGAGKTPPPPPAKTRSSGSAGLWIVLLLLVIAVAALAYSGWTQVRSQTAAQQELQAQLAQQEQRWQAIQQRMGQVSQQQQDQQSGWRESLQGVEKRLEEHSNRLRSLSTTTREDWLLAEVEYLLRLANQRLKMERGTVGALGLLQAADEILLELDDSELFAVRDKLARDLVALRLTPNVDRSGLYLQLAALAEQVEQLPELPRMAKAAAADKPADETVATEAQPGFMAALKAHFWTAMDKLKHQVRIRHNDQVLEPLLPPDGARYLRQNIRFHLEQAQLAMLREETAIYRHSLQQAEQLLRQYFALQPAALLIADQLQQLAQTEVSVKLPSISGSLTALQEHIRKLHLLDDAAGRPQLPSGSSQEPSQEAPQS